jgi:pimeloyl-ACP methyl ester carboxylesterase
MDTVEVAGLRIGYQRAGTGPPLVLLHGAYEDSRVWRRQLEALSDEFTVVAWDAPGCGASADPPPDFSGVDLAEALAGFLRLAVPDRPNLLGFSMGSGIALQLYRAHPDIPSSLLLVSAYAGWAGSLPPEEVERRYAQVLAELEQPPEQFIPVWLPTLFTHAPTRPRCRKKAGSWPARGLSACAPCWAPTATPITATSCQPSRCLRSCSTARKMSGHRRA